MHQKSLLAKSEPVAPDPPDLVIRAADIADLGDFLDLAVVAGAGFTSLPASEPLLAERLHRSKAAFAGADGALMLALEDLDAGRVVGCAAIKAGSAARPDFLNFLLADDQQSLLPSALYGELTEVGSLLVHPDYRQFGVGRWLAQSRYMLIAGDLPRFGDHLFSELRGIIDEDNFSPFYDGVLAPFLDLSYEEADYLSAHGRQAELNAMLPAAPLQISDVGETAKAAIGCPHRDGRKALRFLEDEGFRFEGAVDLLDGGPLVTAPSREIRTIRSSFMARLMPGLLDDGDAEMMILAVGSGADFRSGKGLAVKREGWVLCHPELIQRLRIDHGGLARVCSDRETLAARPPKARTIELCPS